MLKMTIDNEEVVSNKNFTIKEEMLNASSTILNNCYPKTWENDHDYISRFYYPKDYSKLNIQNFSIEPEEAGTTVTVNGSATLNDVDTSKNSKVTKILGQTSQDGTPTPDSPIPINVVSGDNYIDICGKNLLNPTGITSITTSGVTITPIFENGLLQYINVNGTSTGTIVYKQLEYTTSNNEILNGCNGGGSSTYKMDFRVTDGGALYPVYNGEDTTLPNNKVGKVRIVIYNGITLNNVKIYPMIRKSNTNSTYEPYIGHSYPIYLGVENLAIDTTLKNGLWCSSTSIANNSSGWYVIEPCKPNTTYTVSKKNTTGSIFINFTNVFPANGVTTGQNNLGANGLKTLTFTTPSNANYIFLGLFAGASPTDTQKQECIEGLQLETGTKVNHASTTPIELCKIGSYQDSIYKGKGYNLFDKDTTDYTQNYYLDINGANHSGSNWGIYYIPIKPSTAYTISGCLTNSGVYFWWLDEVKQPISMLGSKKNYTNQTSPINAKYLGLSVVWNTSSSDYDGTTLMVNEGSTALPYEPYNAKDKWLLHKEIGKVVLDGSENWLTQGSTTNYYEYRIINGVDEAGTNIQNQVLSNYFEQTTNARVMINSAKTLYLRFPTSSGIDISTLELFTTWLSTHNTIVYYAFVTPTVELITDETLLAQLDDLESS